MPYLMPHRCPVCHHELVVTKLACTHCPTKVEGEFSSCKFCQLPAEQLEFVEAFIKCRGNIKEVEKVLGISYPTVRGRLDSVIEALGYGPGKTGPQNQEESDRRLEILAALERGDLSAHEAARRLRNKNFHD
ncbi:hypothetical protein CEB3_c21640 [Peptococcaceae bacterium CEB3]|nr:hypothetical protein CEB3_c21640 [Peptococcaceae bacterium CEB3]